MRTIRLGDCIRVKHGYPFDGDHIITKDNGIVLTTPGNFTLSGGFKEDNGKFYDGEYSNEYVLKSGTLIVTMTDLSKACDTLGFGAIVPDTGYTYLHNQRIGVVSILDSSVICKDYLYWVMRSKTYRRQIVLTSTGGSTVHHTSPEKIYDIVVDIPESIDEQKQIAHVLNTIDFQISNNKEICSDLESMAKLLYDYWFVQFDFPDENGKPYKSSGGKMVWNEELKREIPDGWEVGNIIDNPLTTVISNGVKKFDTKNYIPTANIVGEKITDGDWITYDNRESRANMEPTKYSVWFAKMKNSIKHLSIPNDSKWFLDKYILSTGFEGIQCDEESFGLIHCIINSEYFEKHKDIIAHGATQESVNDDDLKNIKFTIPDNRVLEQFSHVLNPILEKKFACFYENQKLASLRDFLLPMLMNGQVNVKKGL